MSYWKISGPRATVTVPDHKTLRDVWKTYKHSLLVGRFIVEKPLTPAQLRRLSAKLRDRVSSPDDLVFLEALYALEDPRA
jgi:hypothetical protein